MNDTVEQILKSHSFPHKFYVKYAVACANSCLHQIKDEKQYTIAKHAIDLADAFAKGLPVSEEDLRKASAYNSPFADHAAAYTYAAYCAYAACAPVTYHAAYYAAESAHNANSDIDVKQMLLDMIKEEFTELELILMKK